MITIVSTTIEYWLSVLLSIIIMIMIIMIMNYF